MWLCGRHLLPSFECLRLESSCPDNLMCQGGVLRLDSAQEVLLHHAHDLVDREGGAHTLGRAADRGGAAPPCLELGQLGERRLDVRELRLEGADRELHVRLPAAQPESRVAGDDHRRPRVADRRGRAVGGLDDRDAAVGTGLVLDRPGLQGGDHVEALLLDGVAVAGRLVAVQQPLLHGRDAVGQRDLEVRDGGRDRGEGAAAFGGGRLLRPGGVPGGERLRAGVAAARELVAVRHEVDALEGGEPPLLGLLGDEVAPVVAAGHGVDEIDTALAHGDDRHGADGVEVGADGGERGALGRQLRLERLLDRRAVGVAARVLRVEVADAPCGERGDRHLDPDHRAGGEHLVVGLGGGGDVAGVEEREEEGHVEHPQRSSLAGHYCVSTPTLIGEPFSVSEIFFPYTRGPSPDA